MRRDWRVNQADILEARQRLEEEMSQYAQTRQEHPEYERAFEWLEKLIETRQWLAQIVAHQADINEWTLHQVNQVEVYKKKVIKAIEDALHSGKPLPHRLPGMDDIAPRKVEDLATGGAPPREERAWEPKDKYAGWVPAQVADDVRKCLTNPAIRRLCRRAGIKRVSTDVYEAVRGFTYHWMYQVLGESTVYLHYFKTKTIALHDILERLREKGQTVYGIGKSNWLDMRAHRGKKKETTRAAAADVDDGGEEVPALADGGPDGGD